MKRPILAFHLLLLARFLLPAAELIPVSLGLPRESAIRSGNGVSGAARWADHGRQVFFLSTASDLVDSDPNGSAADVFQWRPDRTTIARVSVAGSLEGDAGPVTEFDVSADGRWCVYARIGSDPALGDSNGIEDVYLRDLETDSTRLLSTRADGLASGNGASRSPAISADGRHVVFESSATDLMDPPTTNGGWRIYVRDLGQGTLELVGTKADPRIQLRELPLINTDGSVVVYQTYGRADGFGERSANLRVWRRETRSVQAVQFPADVPASVVQATIAMSPLLSATGHYLTFVAVPTRSRTNLLSGIWRVDLRQGSEAERISGDFVPAACAAREGAPMSPDGQMVAFTINAKLGGHPTNQVRIWKAGEGVFSLGQLPPNGSTEDPEITRWEPWISADGNAITFVSADAVAEAGVSLPGALHLYHREITTGATRRIGRHPGQHPPELNPEAGTVLWETLELRGDAGDDPALMDLVQTSLVTLESRVLSTARSQFTQGMAAGNSRTGAGISDDGRRLAFESDADDLVERESSRTQDLFVFETGNRTIRNISSNPSHGALGGVAGGRVSRQGRHVAVTRSGGGWVEGDAMLKSGIYLVDLEAGTTALASISSDGSQPLADFSSDPVLSGDGRWVGFQNLTRPRGAPRVHLYLRDMRHQRTWWLTDPAMTGSDLRVASPENLQLAATGEVGLFRGPGAASWTVFQPSGETELRRVALSADDALLSADGSRIFLVRNATSRLEAERGVFETRPFSGSERRLLSPGAAAISGLQCSADGLVLTYVRRPAVGAGDSPGDRQIWALAVETGVERLVSIAIHGAPGAGISRDPVISMDGRIIAFRSEATDLVAGDTNGVADIFTHDRYTGITTMASRRPDGRSGNDLSTRPQLSGDGRWLTFTTFASNLVPNDYNTLGDVVITPLAFATAPDLDGDRLPDGWELDQFGHLDRNGAEDADRDGLTNAEEYLTRTAPTDARSALSLGVEVDAQDGIQLVWRSHAGVGYQVQRQVSDGWVEEGNLLAGYEGFARRNVLPGLYRIQAISME